MSVYFQPMEPQTAIFLLKQIGERDKEIAELKSKIAGCALCSGDLPPPPRHEFKDGSVFYGFPQQHPDGSNFDK